jgi:DNA repair protein RadC
LPAFAANRTKTRTAHYTTILRVPCPSEADVRVTRRISEASRILQIRLLDHVIIGQPMNGRQGYFSFKEAGIIG